MADNFTTNAGSGGETFASDDIGGVQHQRVKLIHGADGTNDGDVSTANPLPTDTREIGGTAVDADTGNASGGTQRVVLASDQPAVTVDLGANNDVTLATLPDTASSDLAAINTAVSGTLTVGSHDVTNAGTFAVQEDGAALTALQLIDDPVATDDISTHTAETTKVMGIGVVATPTDTSVDANDIAMPAMSTDRRLHTDTQIVGQDAALDVSGATVNVASASALDCSGATVTVDGSGVTQPVSGTVTANLGATDNAVLDNIDTNTGNTDTNTTDLPNVIGTDGSMGPSKAVSIGGTDGSGNLQEVTTDTDGHLQVDVLSGGGSGTEYTEDDAAAANPVGGAQICVRQDTPASEVTTNGDNIARRATQYGAAYSQIVDSSGNFVDSFGGGTQYTEGDTDATITGTVLMWEDSADTLVAASAAKPVPVDGSGVTQPVSGTVTANAGTGTFTVQEASALDVSAATVNVASASALDCSGATVTVDLGANNDVQGAAAEGAAVSGNPFLIAGDDGTKVKHVAVAADGAIHVDDGGNSLTVDGTVTADAGAGTFTIQEATALDVSAATVNVASASALDCSGATVTVDLGANNDVTIDNSSIVHAEDAVHNSGDAGVMSLAVRKDSAGTLVSGDGDYAPLQTNGSGRLRTSAAQSGTWNINNVSGTVSLPTGAATAANQLPDGHNVTVDNASGASAVNIQDGGNSITVDGADLTTIAGAVSGSEMQVDVVASLPAGTNAIGKLAANDGVDIGDVDVTSISAGSNLIGDVGLSGARTSGGTTLYRNVDVDESGDEIKGSAGQVYWIHAMNLSSSVVYLQFYNATAASVTVGTTTPDMTFPLATQGDTNGAGFTLSIPNGIAFGTAITIAATTTIGGSGGPGANEVIVNLGYA